MNGIEKDIYVKWPNGFVPDDKDSINPQTNDVISWGRPDQKISTQNLIISLI